MTILTEEQLQELRDMPADELAAAVSATTERLFDEGRAYYAPDGDFSPAYKQKLLNVYTEAGTNPGCEVKMTVPGTAQLVFISLSLQGAFDKAELLDMARTKQAKMFDIELTNGSCVTFISEEEEAANDK